MSQGVKLNHDDTPAVSFLSFLISSEVESEPYMGGYPESEAQALIWRIQDATGLSDGGLARACGVGRVTVWRIRNGEQSGERILPKLAQLWRIHDPDYEVQHVRFHSMEDAPYFDPSRDRNAARTRQRAQRRQTRGETRVYAQKVQSLTESLLRSWQGSAASQTPPPVAPTIPAQVTPRSAAFSLTPARTISRSPVLVCTMCCATVPTSQGYTGVWKNAQVYLCSRACADRLVNQR